MAPRRGAALTVTYRSSGLQSLLGVAREVLQQTARGLDPRLSLSALSTAAQAAAALTAELTDQSPLTHEVTALWSYPGLDAAAYLALYALALRRSSPSLTGEGTEHIYAHILDNLSRQLGRVCHLADPVPYGHSMCRDLVAPVLLRAGALECYSRLLADAAQKLKPAAAAALAEHSRCAEGSSAAEVSQADATAAAAAATAAAVSAATAAAAGGRHQHAQDLRPPQNTPASQPTDSDYLELVNTTQSLILGLVSGVYQSASGSGSGGSGRGGGSSGGREGADSGGNGNAASSPTNKDLRMQELRTKLQSSWVLEHWAQVLLLSTAVASVRDGGQERTVACAAQARLLDWLCKGMDVAEFGLSLALRRPCGCALAATHMAQLCAALDGGGAFGAVKPEVLVLPACTNLEYVYLARTDRKVKTYDDVAMRLRRAVDLHAAVCAASAWTTLLLASGVPQEPPCETAHPHGDGECPTDYAARQCRFGTSQNVDFAGQEGAGTSQEAVSAGQEGAGTSQEAVSAGQEGAGTSQEAVSAGQEGAGTSQEAVSAGQEGAGTSQEAVSAGQEGAGKVTSDVRLALEEEDMAEDTCLGKLPPFNRTATFHLCLRLAKGLLACWGRPLSGVRLELPTDNPSAPAPLLLKEQSCALLHWALACARLALLPAVWGRGREGVPRRTRVGLRAWWETYVAAAQHPEALAVGQLERPEYPNWTEQGQSVCKWCG